MRGKAIEDCVGPRLGRRSRVVSIIIPTWNEERELPATLDAVNRLHPGGGESEATEVILVDAGSTDATVAIGEEAGARVIACDERSRAQQMNLGAAAARGEILWFVHADTWVPAKALQSIGCAMRDPRVVGGGFHRWFRTSSLLLKLTCALAGVRGWYSGLYYGDQALVVRQSAFEQLGGFRPLPVFEDFDLCQRLRQVGRMAYLQPAVQGSARRFAGEGAWTVTWRDAGLTRRYLQGESPDTLWKELQDSVRAPS